MASETKGARRRGWRRVLRWLGRAALALLGLLALVYVTRELWLHPWLARTAERQVRERLGAELAIGGFESSWFGGARLADVSWHSSEAPLLALEAPTVVAEWSLPGLLRGDLSRLRLELGVEHAELATPPSKPEPPDPTKPTALPEHLPAVSARVERLSYAIDGARSVEVRGLELDLAPEAEGGDANAAGERLALAAAEVTWRDGERELARPLELGARYRAGLVRLEPSSLGDALAIDRGEVDLTRLAQGELTWSVAARALAGKLTSSGRASDALSTSFSVDSLEVARIEDLLGPVLPEDLDRRLVPVVSVRGEVRTAAEASDFDLELEWLEARNHAVALRGVDLTAAVGGDWRESVRSVAGRLLLEDVDRNALAAGGPELPPLDLDLSAELADGRAELAGEVETPGGRLAIERGEVVLGPAERLVEDARCDLDLQADFDDLGPLGRALGLALAGSLRGQIDVTGPLLEPTGRLETRAAGISVRDLELGGVDLAVVAAGGRIDVLSCEVANSRFGASLTGGVLPAEGRFDDVQLELSASELALGPVAPRELAVSLAAGGPFAAPEGAFSLRIEDLGTAGLEGLDVRAGGRFAGRALELESLLAEEGELALFAKAQAELGENGEVTGALEELELSGPDGLWRLVEAAELAWPAAGLPEARVGPLVLASEPAEGAAGRAELALAAGRLEAGFERFTAAPLRERTLPPGWALGGLEGRVEVALPNGAEPPTALFDLALEGLLIRRGEAALAPQRVTLAGELKRERAIELALRAERPGGTVELDLAAPLDLAGGGELFQPGPVHARLASGPLELEELGGVLGLPPDLTGRLTLDAELAGEWNALAGAIDLRGEGLSSEETEAALQGPLALAARLALGERIALEEARISGPESSLLVLDGGIEAAVDATAWLADPGALTNAPLALEGRLELPLEGWTERIESVRRLAGRLDGSLVVAGSLGAPEARGAVELRAVELRLASALPSIRNLNAELELTPERLQIQSMGLEFGGAPCTVTGGADLAPELVLELGFEGANLLIARNATTRLRANADVEVSGPLSALALSGEVVVTEGRFAQDVDLLSKLVPGGGGGGAPATGGEGELRLSFGRSGPVATMTFEQLRVRSRGDLRLKGNLYDFTLRPDLTIHGTGEVPMFEGEVYVEPSMLSLPSGRLQVESGVVRFSREDPFRPRITLAAGMETKGYDVSARIDGPVGDPEVLLTSSPPLANDELLLLFLAGQTPSSGSQGMAAAQTVGVYLAQDALVRWLGGGTKEADSLLDNLVFEIGADVTHTGAPTMVGRYYLDSRRKRTGRTTYLLAEKDVWDKTNFGYGIRFRFE